MSTLTILLLLLLWTMIGACADAAEPEPRPLTRPFCVEGQTRELACGASARGRTTQRCQGARWIEQTACLLPEGCEPGPPQVTLCEPPQVGQEVTLCEGGQRRVVQACQDPPEDPPACEPEQTRQLPCGPLDAGTQPQRCVLGRWLDAGECSVPTRCSARDQPQRGTCGLNRRGQLTSTCGQDGRWQTRCEDPDVCVDEATRPLECLDAQGWEGRQLDRCVQGQWSAGPCQLHACPNPELSARVIHADVGTQNSCAVVETGQVYCWGDHTWGQLGPRGRALNPNVTGVIQSARPLMIEGICDAAQVAVGFAHVCALHQDGRVSCWGMNSAGQLGDASLQQRDSPQVIPELSDVVQLATSALHTCALTRSGEVLCWGLNDLGQLGDGTRSPHRAAPTKVEPLPQIVQLQTGYFRTCAVSHDGALWCWGINRDGQLADPSLDEDLYAWPQRHPRHEDVQQVAAGYYHTCAIRAHDKVWCWGLNYSGQLGDGDRVNSYADAVASLRVGPSTTLAAGFDHTCALAPTGKLWCWGANDLGQAGDLTLSASVTTPQEVSPGRRFGQIALADYHSCAVDHDQHLWCWGDNEDGQLASLTAGYSALALRVTLPGQP